jgi:hypothetical protein
MGHFCITEWRDNLRLRKSKQDACVPIREFTYQAYKWIWNYRPVYSRLGPKDVSIDTLCGPLRNDLEDVEGLLYIHFIILGDGAIQNFIQQGEYVARHLLNHRLDAAWKEFCNRAQQKGKSTAFESIAAAMNNLELYFADPGRELGLLRTFEGKVSVPWPSVRHSLVQGYVLIPVRAFEDLWRELADFVQDARENYALPCSGGGWWTGIVDGQFQHFTASEAVRGPAIGETAEVQNADLAANIAVHISDSRQGRIPEDRLLGVLIYILKAANVLAQMLDAPAFDRKASQQQSGAKSQKPDMVSLQEKAKEAKKQSKEKVARWAEALAPIVWSVYPAMRLTLVARLLSSAEERSRLAKQIADPHAKAQLNRTPPEKKVGWRSIYDKLSEAVDQGRLAMPASKLVLITKS